MPELTFLSRINELRHCSGLSYKALARRMKGSPGSLHRIFNGEDKPWRDTVIRLALAMNLDVETTDEILRLAGFPGLLAANPGAIAWAAVLNQDMKKPEKSLRPAAKKAEGGE